MRTRPLGRSGLDVPRICFGAYALGGGYWGRPDDAQSTRAVRLAVDLGMNAFDTAPVYGMGHSEEVLGRALKGIRDRALILTKIGVRWDGDGDFPYDMPDRDGNPVKVRFDASPASVRLEVERSLKRLHTDRLDLVQVHTPDPTTPIADTMGALDDLRGEGKLRAIGVSNYSIAQLEEARLALGSTPLASDQPQYSLLERAIERDTLPWAIRHQVGILAFAALDQGVLTGRFRDDRTLRADEGRGRRPTYQPENRRRINHVLDTVVQPIADAHSATLSQVVLAHTVAREGVTALLVGARTEEQVRENAAAGDLDLSDAERATIDTAFRELKLVLPSKSLWARAKRKVKGMLGR